MQSLTGIARRLAVMGIVLIGLMGLAINPAVARELCSENGSLALADGNGDGVVSRGEIQAVIDAAQGVEGVDQLQELLNGLPGDVTGIRYKDCAASGDGSGTGTDGSGSGNDGSGTGGEGSGSGTEGGDGSGTGADGGAASGDADGTGTGDADGTGTGTGDAATGEGGTVVINAEGTPIDAITGLPDTGQMPPAQASGTVSAWLLLGIVGTITGAGALLLRGRAHAG